MRPNYNVEAFIDSYKQFRHEILNSRLLDVVTQLQQEAQFYIIDFELKVKSGGNPTKLFFFVNKEFFRFLLLSLAIVQHKHFFYSTNSQA